MEISLLKLLLKNISSFSQLSSFTGASLDVNRKYYQKVEELLNLLKPILDAIVSSEIASDEMLNKSFEVLGQSVDELRDLFENWLPLSSKFYFVLQAELLISKARNLALEICLMLKSQQHLPDELNSTSAEYCMQKIKHIVSDQTSTMIEEATRYQGEGIEPSPEILSKITESLNLKSNQEILIEAVALEKLKVNAEQAEKIEEAVIIDQMIALVMHLHDRLVLIKESKTNSPVPIPADFCCPLSLELMTDPVIVASGQTYERAFIKNWIELGLTVCPKTRQALAHINLIPNYTVKALIANWCEINKVKLPDPTKYASLNQPSKLLGHAEACSPNDHHAFSPSRGSQTLSTEHNLSTSSPGKSLISSSWIHREGTSPLHPRSTSEGSLPFVATNGQVLDEARLSLMSSEERSTDMDERNGDSVPESVASPPGSRVSVVDRSVGKLMQNHNRSASAGAVVNHTSYPHGVLEDSNESSNVGNHGTAYGSDTSGEVKVEPQGSTTMNSPHREPEFFPRFLDPRARNQSIWRRSSDRPVPRIVSSPTTETRADLAGVEAQVRKLVEDLKSGSVETQREATAELRLLAKHNTDNRIVIANCGAIRLLVDLLHSTDTAIQENAVTALLNLSINDNNKAAIGNALAIEPLIHVLETGSAEAKSNSAATLFSLSVIEENKVKIGRSGAIEPLVKLLGNGTPRGKKDAATALFNLSIFHENKARIVQAGAVRHLMELMDPAAGMVDKAVAVLANLATIPEGRTAIGQGGGIPVLVEVVELGSARGKENAAAGLLQLCKNSSRFCNTVLQEGAVPPLVALSQSGTPRAKEKAQQLLNHFKNQRHGNAGRG